jgi:hypothetical protein
MIVAPQDIAVDFVGCLRNVWGMGMESPKTAPLG